MDLNQLSIKFSLNEIKFRLIYYSVLIGRNNDFEGDQSTGSERLSEIFNGTLPVDHSPVYTFLNYSNGSFKIISGKFNFTVKQSGEPNQNLKRLINRRYSLVAQIVSQADSKGIITLNIFPFYDHIAIPEEKTQNSSDLYESDKNDDLLSEDVAGFVYSPKIGNLMIYSEKSVNRDFHRIYSPTLFAEGSNVHNYNKVNKVAESLKSLFEFIIDGNTYFLVSKSDILFKKNELDRKCRERKEKKLQLTESHKEKSDADSTSSESDRLFYVTKPLQINNGNSTLSSEHSPEKFAFALISNFGQVPVLMSSDNINGVEKSYFKADSFLNDEDSGDQSYSLVMGRVFFSDEKIYTNNSIVNRIDDDYARAWELYSNLEMLVSIRKREKLGEIRICNINKSADTIDLILSKKIDLNLLNDGDLFQVSRNSFDTPGENATSSHSKLSSLDEHINDEEILSEYIADKLARFKQFSKGFCIELSLVKSKSSPQLLAFSYEDGMVLPQVGWYLSLSLNGNATQNERRVKAREALLSDNSANPLLKGIICGESTDTVFTKHNTTFFRQKISPLSPRIEKKLFARNPPTKTQLEAIDIALNTPDIALIQGPPGTGKTTVITAIIERLNELFIRQESIKGNILVSSFQHDAVENIIERLSINSLPVIKFGEKMTQADLSRTDELIDAWIKDTCMKIRQRNPELRLTEETVRFIQLKDSYIISPSEALESKILDEIINSKHPAVLANSNIKNEARVLKIAYSKVYESGDQEVIGLLNRLRTKPTAFKDDGVIRASELLAYLESIDANNDPQLKNLQSLLKQALSIQDDDLLKNHLKVLEGAKKEILLRFIPKETYSKYKVNGELLGLCKEVEELLKKSELNPVLRKERVVSEFLNVLESYPESLRNSLKDYQLVFSATTQQSMGKEIFRAKLGEDSSKKSNKNIIPCYDTVIIDEAARANPSDLIIPMVQGANRIILVGDHRQLPQMVDEEIIKEIAEKFPHMNINDSVYKSSMFELLFLRLKQMEKIDGIKRTITLDAQFRTHPVLGAFGSKNFYESHNKSEGYRSPLGAELFQQNLPNIENRYCTWFHVPYGDNQKMESRGTSKYRRSEADFCAQLLSIWLNSAEGANLSFGVITFYRAQVMEIMERLSLYGITEKDSSNGTYQFASKYRFLPNGKERIRVGSVDAFQGMEFDIVLLSIVRTFNDYDMSHLPPRSLLGFLTVENRLCVSMSRQKKFLGIVGDARLALSEACKKHVPSLFDFFRMCYVNSWNYQYSEQKGELDS